MSIAMEAPSTLAASVSDEICHITWCCDENRSLCGIDLSDTPWCIDDDPPMCVVCEDLDAAPCPGCGAS